MKKPVLFFSALLLALSLFSIPSTQAQAPGECVQFGTRLDGVLLWAGDCIASGATATATTVPPTDTPPPPSATPTMPAPGGALTYFSAGIEVPLATSHPGGTDLFHLWNPAGSGRNLYLDFLHIAQLGATGIHYDIWLTEAAGASCTRVIQSKPADFTSAPPAASVALAHSRCSTDPLLYQPWSDGPWRQFPLDSSNAPVWLDLAPTIIPPGRGLMIRNDNTLLAGSTVFFYLEWSE